MGKWAFVLLICLKVIYSARKLCNTRIRPNGQNNIHNLKIQEIFDANSELEVNAWGKVVLIFYEKAEEDYTFNFKMAAV